MKDRVLMEVILMAKMSISIKCGCHMMLAKMNATSTKSNSLYAHCKVWTKSNNKRF